MTWGEQRYNFKNEHSFAVLIEVNIVVLGPSKKSNTRQLILEKATDLFFEQGFASASIRDIVGAVGVTNSTVYIHFKDKNEILYIIIDEIGTTLGGVLREAIRKSHDPVECLRNMIFAQVCLVREKRKEIKIYMEDQFQLPRPLRKKVLEQHRAIYEVYYNKFSEIHGEGLLKDIDQTVMTFCIFAMMNWAYRWYHETGPLSIEEIADDIIRILFTGVLNDAALSEKKVSSLSNKGGKTSWK
ncbi:MAG: TetR/AcrR family transcriptional regulator [Pseudomonadota bacterium]